MLSIGSIVNHWLASDTETILGHYQPLYATVNHHYTPTMIYQPLTTWPFLTTIDQPLTSPSSPSDQCITPNHSLVADKRSCSCTTLRTTCFMANRGLHSLLVNEWFIVANSAVLIVASAEDGEVSGWLTMVNSGSFTRQKSWSINGD